MAKTGRPSSYKPEFARQAAKLAELGATDQEVADFFEVDRTEEEFFAYWLDLKRQDRSGVIAVHKKKRTAAKRKRLDNSPSLRLKEATRSRIWASLKGATDGALFSRLGYSVDRLRAHLESLFDDGMTWANYGKWHVDHIKPCAKFDLTDPHQFKECWSLENLQPLWAQQNCRKGANYGAA